MQAQVVARLSAHAGHFRVYIQPWGHSMGQEAIHLKKLFLFLLSFFLVAVYSNDMSVVGKNLLFWGWKAPYEKVYIYDIADILPKYIRKRNFITMYYDV